ncbi:hypothetical protein G6F68_021762 [Rhizopus microsporus]|nr:hypothetical protein G6F68_021762 [Rhizopus microsporus]
MAFRRSMIVSVLASDRTGYTVFPCNIRAQIATKRQAARQRNRGGSAQAGNCPSASQTSARTIAASRPRRI